MQRPCDVCQTVYEAKRASSKYCSSRCRTRAARGHATVVAAIVAVDEVPPGLVETAALTQLREVEREATTLGQAALALARRVDVGRDTGAGLAALVKQLEATVRAAAADVTSEASPLDKARDQLAQRRAQRGA